MVYDIRSYRMGQENPFTESSGALCRRIRTADPQSYRLLHNESLENREAFWKQQASRISWDTPYDTVFHEDFNTASISWFDGGKLNACRNVFGQSGSEPARNNPSLVYYASDMSEHRFEKAELAARVNEVAAGLAAKGISSGDKVALYLHDCPETVFLMLACSKIGAAYVPVPSGFTPEVAGEIINDCAAKLLLLAMDSASPTYRERATALKGLLSDIIIITTGPAAEGLLPFSDFASRANPSVEAESVDAEHPLYILYANSATGIPRGSVFPTGGYLVQAAASYDCIFNAAGIDSVFTTIDLASSAGQAYGLWGPLLSGSTIIISAAGEDIITNNLAEILKNGSSTAFFTSPRVLTSLKTGSDGSSLDEASRFSLVVACGDVLTPRLVKYAGASLTTAPEQVLNLWIQSESGTALINTYAAQPLNRPGALGLAFPGVHPLVVNTMGEPCKPNESGQLVFSGSWPAMIRAINGQQERFRELYFQREPGYFSTNDGVRMDDEGMFWFMGRLDDVIKVRGRSLATSEIEAILVAHEKIAEAVVVSIGITDGWKLYAFLVLQEAMVDRAPESGMTEFRKDLSNYIAGRIGEFAVPDMFIVTSELPRTRTGKIVRRILRRVATGDISPEEDLSHVANPESIDKIMNNKDI